ncbi:uncharacterized protein [Nicotiana sylvestris]|uniref:uncharacterized protein n=1 Tax=Nicotiana sylvestris TaxID=4096 RepID=UPI00388C45B9
MIKLNTDGSYTTSNGISRLGGILRDYKVNLIMAFSQPTTCSSNIIAEAVAVKFGVQWCILNGYKNFSLELDSIAVAQMIMDKQANIYKMVNLIYEISQILSQGSVNVSHCFREANSLVKLA